jgi:hypothetical protein
VVPGIDPGDQDLDSSQVVEGAGTFGVSAATCGLFADVCEGEVVGGVKRAVEDLDLGAKEAVVVGQGDDAFGLMNAVRHVYIFSWGTDLVKEVVQKCVAT